MTFNVSELSWLAVQFVLCVLAGDFITGLVHWWEDAYAHLGWKNPLRSLVAEPNIVHHEDQTAFLAGSWWYRSWHTFALAAIVWWALLAFGVLTWHAIVIGSVAACGNEVHAWAHRRAPWPARMLQDMGVLTTPQQHAKHHRAPYDRCYCTVTNLLNPPLDAVGFWRRLEWLLACVGVPLRRQTPERRGV